MTEIRYVLTKRRAGGETAWYWNPPSFAKKAGLFSEALGTNERRAMVRAVALNDMLDKAREADAGGKVDQGLVRAGISRYLKGDKFKRLRPSTQRIYLQALARLDVAFGKYHAHLVRPKHVEVFYARLKRASGEGKAARLATAASTMRVGRLLWKAFVRWEIAKDNPFAGETINAAPSREVRWTRSDVDRFVAVAHERGEFGIALAVQLAFELCQRQADILALSWGQLIDGRFRIFQQKTNAEVHPLIPLQLQQALAMLPAQQAEMIVQTDGRPWRESVHKFRRRFRELATAAKLPSELQFMDLRRSGLTEMADAGATDNELMAVSGHKTREMVSVYARVTAAQASHGLEKRWRYASQGA